MSDPIYSKQPSYKAPVIGHKNVTTAGTQVVISATATQYTSVVVQAKGSNTGVIFLGDSTVPNNYQGGIALGAGDCFTIGAADLNKWYINSTVNGEGISYLIEI